MVNTYDVTDVYEIMDTNTLKKCIECRDFAQEYERKMGLDNTVLSNACAVSDVGMTYISPAIKEKPEPLMNSEQLIIRAHAFIGYQILLDFQLEELAKIVLYHQINGEQSPEVKSSGVQLTEEQKKIAKQVGTIDVYIALISERPYRHALSPLEAYRYLKSKGQLYDTDILNYIKETQIQ